MNCSFEGGNIMRYLVTLQLNRNQKSVEDVKHLAGFQDVNIDNNYGVVTISPKRNLYAIRVLGNLDVNQLKATQPKVQEIYGDTSIASV